MTSKRFRQWVDKYQDQAWTLARYLLKNPSEAEDVCQEAFVKLWHHQDVIAPDKIKPWLMKVTRNGCLDRLRRRRPSDELSDRMELASGIVAYDDRVGHRQNLVCRQRCTLRMLHDGIGIFSLVNTHGTEGAVFLFQHIGTYPFYLSGHFLVGHAGRLCGGIFQVRGVFPCPTAHNNEQLHCISPWWCVASGLM
jgi:RNA polymerase sigma factor (sigma-70 family)